LLRFIHLCHCFLRMIDAQNFKNPENLCK
jgi:hypothetical protein